MMRVYAAALLCLLTGCVAINEHAAPTAPNGLIFIVRHAERASNTPQDKDPSLSEVGQQRAQALAKALANSGIRTILTTQYRRTIETAAPLAQALQVTSLPVVTKAGAAKGEHAKDVAAAALRSSSKGNVLVVGHSNTVTEILAALSGPVHPALCEDSFHHLFIVERRGMRTHTVTHVSYGERAATPVGDRTCL
jgi:phosphohistidine phosphatase SixA